MNLTRCADRLNILLAPFNFITIAPKNDKRTTFVIKSAAENVYECIS